MKNKLRFSVCLCFLIIICMGVVAYPQPGWFYQESRHFRLAYTANTAAYAEECLMIAESTYETLAGYFGYPSGKHKIGIVLRDNYDYSNGLSRPREYHVEIYCRNTPSLYRQQQRDWLACVLSHELSHVYSMMRFESSILFTLGLSALDLGRGMGVQGDFTYGINRIPRWFVEGAAQLGSQEYRADHRDPYREMILKDAWARDALLSLSAMSRFEGSSLDSELVYNQGFDLVNFLVEEYPDVSFGELCQLAASSGFEKSFLSLYDRRLEDLYFDWVAGLAARFAGENESAPGKKLFDKNSRILPLEVASAAGGEYVVANWGNDFALYNLFKRNEDGSYARFLSDTGMVLKQDRGNGMFWVNRECYNPSTETYTYDLFSFAPGTKPERQTKESRCIAFAARDGHLYYVSYKAGVNVLRHRFPGGMEKVVKVFRSGESIFSLAVFPANRLLFEVGEDSGLLLLEPGGEQRLWEGLRISEPVAGKGDDVYFVSTLDGAPQLYRSSLDNPGEWFRLTDCTGVRFPAYEIQDGHSRLSFSVYEAGGYIRYSLENPEAAGVPVAPRLPAGRGAPPERAEYEGQRLLNSPFIISRPGIGLYITLLGDSLMPEELTIVDLISRIDFNVSNLPGSMKFHTWLSWEGPLYYEGGEKPWQLPEGYTHGGVELRHQFGYVDNYLYYSLDTVFDFLNTESIVLYQHDFLFNTGFQIVPGVLYSTLGVSYFTQRQPDIPYYIDENSFTFENTAHLSAYQQWVFNYQYKRLNYNREIPALNDVYEVVLEANHHFQAGCEYSRAPYNVKDPAGVGQGFYSVQLFYEHDFVKDAEITVDNSLTGNYFTHSYGLLLAAVQGRLNLADSRLSLAAAISGQACVDQSDDAYWLSGALPSLSDYFSAYPAGYTNARDLVKLDCVLRFNPLVDVFSSPHWYERGHLMLRGEMGILRHFSGSGFVEDLPVALEVGYEHELYLSPVFPATLGLSYRTALNNFLGASEIPGSFLLRFSY